MDNRTYIAGLIIGLGILGFIVAYSYSEAVYGNPMMVSFNKKDNLTIEANILRSNHELLEELDIEGHSLEVLYQPSDFMSAMLGYGRQSGSYPAIEDTKADGRMIYRDLIQHDVSTGVTLRPCDRCELTTDINFSMLDFAIKHVSVDQHDATLKLEFSADILSFGIEGKYSFGFYYDTFQIIPSVKLDISKSGSNVTLDDIKLTESNRLDVFSIGLPITSEINNLRQRLGVLIDKEGKSLIPHLLKDINKTEVKGRFQVMLDYQGELHYQPYIFAEVDLDSLDHYPGLGMIVSYNHDNKYTISLDYEAVTTDKNNLYKVNRLLSTMGITVGTHMYVFHVTAGYKVSYDAQESTFDNHNFKVSMAFLI